MRLITYTEAASILGVSVQTLKQALEPDRNVFTRAGRRGTNGLLIEEQVRLFIGINPRTGKKKRLSLNALTSEEQARWQRYAREALTANQQTSAIVEEEAMRRVAREEIEKNRALEFIDVLRAVQEYIRSGVPQGDFFRKHPLLASITYLLMSAVSLAGVVAMYNALTERQRKEVIAYLGMLDAALESQEREPEPPMNIEEIRRQRAYIAQFKQKAAAA